MRIEHWDASIISAMLNCNALCALSGIHADSAMMRRRTMFCRENKRKICCVCFVGRLRRLVVSVRIARHEAQTTIATCATFGRMTQTALYTTAMTVESVESVVGSGRTSSIARSVYLFCAFSKSQKEQKLTSLCHTAMRPLHGHENVPIPQTHRALHRLQLSHLLSIHVRQSSNRGLHALRPHDSSDMLQIPHGV